MNKEFGLSIGSSFSKFHNDIKLKHYLKPDLSHDVETIWIGNDGYYAFFHTSGLRAISNELYDKLKKFIV